MRKRVCDEREIAVRTAANVVRAAAKDVSPRAQGDVHRERSAMFGARTMLHRGPSVRRQLPAGALAGAAPCGGAGEIELSRPARHRRRGVFGAPAKELPAVGESANEGTSNLKGATKLEAAATRRARNSKRGSKARQAGSGDTGKGADR